MLYIDLLNGHHSSRTSMYSRPNELAATRSDLYTGADFYFGFDSSNHTFLDIIGDKQPLAIKYGPILSLYQSQVGSACCSIYYIDPRTATLHPILDIRATAQARSALQRIIPWSFDDLYLQAFQSANTKIETSPDSLPNEQSLLTEALEQLAKLQWPSKRVMEQLPHVVSTITADNPELTISLVDLEQLKNKVTTPQQPVHSTNFVASYNPFFDNARISVEFLVEQTPDHVRVRSIDGKDPCIEIIIPGLPLAEGYHSLYKSNAPGLYRLFTESLQDGETLTQLLKEQFPEPIQHYMLAHALGQEEQPKSVAPQ